MHAPPAPRETDNHDSRRVAGARRLVEGKRRLEEVYRAVRKVRKTIGLRN